MEKLVYNSLYILVYDDRVICELDFEFRKDFINDSEIKEIYKHYIESKFLKAHSDDYNPNWPSDAAIIYED